jgi:hypothetical protein
MSDSEDSYQRDDKGRFVPGTPPGPGRPKGSKSFSLKTALLKVIEDNGNDEDDYSKLLMLLARRAFREAGEGDFKFWKEIMDRLDGPVKQEIQADQTIVIERVSKRIQEDGDDQDLPSDSH